MATIAINVEPEWGVIQSTFVLAKRLRERGHAVEYWTEAPFAPLIRDVGFACTVHDYDIEQARQIVMRRWKHASHRVRKKALRRRLARMEAASIRAFEAWLRTKRPDVVMIGVLNWPRAIAALRCNIPVLKLNPTFVEPFDVTRAPAVSRYVPTARLRAWRLGVHGALWAIVGLVRFAMAKFAPPLNPAFGHRGFAREAKRHGGRLRMTEYGPTLDVPEFVALPSAIEYPFASTSCSRHYLGLGDDEGQRHDGDPLLWLQADDPRPLVYCAFGTLLHNSPRVILFLSRLIECFRHRSDLRLIIARGSAPSKAPPWDVPANVTLAAWVPQRELLTRAHLFISHCGTASVRDAIASGVPLIALPHHGEQFGTSSRIVFHGIGVRGRYDASVPQIDRWVTAGLAGPYGSNMRRLRNRCLSAGELDAAVNAFERYIPVRS